MDTCTRGTRKDLLDLIDSWARADDFVSGVLSLKGMAGEGKSTVAKTIAVKAQSRKQLGASYFFSRREGENLRKASYVVPTLVYQLAMYNASFREHTLTLLTEQPDWAIQQSLVNQARILAKLLHDYTPPSIPPLVILDAFDECDPPESTTLLSLILGIAYGRFGKPTPLRIFVTSRPESNLKTTFDNYCENYHLYDMESSVIREDIRIYLDTAMRPLRRQLRLPDTVECWFTDDELESLCNRAGRLFVYTATAVRILKAKPPGDPKRQLARLLMPAVSSGVGYKDLDSLYLQVLTPFASSEHQSSLQNYIKVVGSLIFMRDPVSIQPLAHLLDVPLDALISTLDLLQSVVSLKESPTIYHVSFSDFVTTRCSDQSLRIDQDDQETFLATRCLETLISKLRYNMADIQDPTKDFTERSDVGLRIASDVIYASRFWGSHLKQCPRQHNDETLVKLLEYFTSNFLVWWIELCSILGRLKEAIQCGQDALKWIVRIICNLTGQLPTYIPIAQPGQLPRVYSYSH